jgi:hypothetical protein
MTIHREIRMFGRARGPETNFVVAGGATTAFSHWRAYGDNGASGQAITGKVF